MGPIARARTRRGLLVLVALAASVHAALGAGSLGDYPGDAGPALDALLRGDLHAFSAAQPAMGAFSLLLRLPFAGLAHLGGPPTQLEVYRWGVFPCVAAIGLLGVWLAEIARSRGTGLPGQVAIVALAVLNPFVTSAVGLGHPEELLTASLAIGAVVAAVHRRSVLTAVLLGLALATKQWAVIAVLPVLLALDARRLRVLAGAAAIAGGITLLAVVGSPGAFLANQLALVHEHYLEPPTQSWLYSISPRVTLHLPHGLVHHGPRLPGSVVGLLHPLIIGVALAIAAYLARLGPTRRTLDRLFAAIALAFLLRCTLDTETMTYYHAPLFATLLAWDALRGERLPLRGLAAAGLAYVVLDRLGPGAIGTGPAALAYLAATVGLAVALAATLVRAPRARVPGDPARPGRAGSRSAFGGRREPSGRVVETGA
ncbi:MAG: hypothetical protein QOD61_1819 [Solirubrobacteraceae bacterium]|nr:hypothetical protein [Solirubrobacteraceae bacterium]